MRWRGGFEGYASKPPKPVRFLLDENFPNLPGFLQALGSTTTGIESLHDFAPDLTDTGTPDWYLYLRAAEAEFDALVTRDKSQAEQPEEMWVLSQTEISVEAVPPHPLDVADPHRDAGQFRGVRINLNALDIAGIDLGKITLKSQNLRLYLNPMLEVFERLQGQVEEVTRTAGGVEDGERTQSRKQLAVLLFGLVAPCGPRSKSVPRIDGSISDQSSLDACITASMSGFFNGSAESSSNRPPLNQANGTDQ